MKYPSYRYPTESLHTGASFGNLYAFIRLDEKNNVHGLWSSVDNQWYCGEWDIDIIVNGKKLEPVETIYYPESQVCMYKHDKLEIEHRFLLPYVVPEKAADCFGDLCGIMNMLRCSNHSLDDIEIVIRHSLFFPAKPSNKFTKQPPDDQCKKCFDIEQKERYCEVVTQRSPQEGRIFGSSEAWQTCHTNEQSLVADYKYIVEHGNNCSATFALGFSNKGRTEALQHFYRCLDAEELLQKSIEHYSDILSRTEIITPDPVINRGLQWSKVNTVRVQHVYRHGKAFTNDPPQDIVVIRDLAWYVLGSDYLTPQFSRDILQFAEQFAFHEQGKLTEYLHANETVPARHDYKLNINDDTPLYVYALYHHALTCRDEFNLAKAYPLMKMACDWISSQTFDGLVRCYSDGIYVWGICSWRNIIDDYNLTGAVTEINAECYYALHVTALVARMLGKETDEEKYEAAAVSLHREINDQLVSEKTGLYLLHLDNKELRHHDITGDLIFPVMFGIASEKMSEKVLGKLTDDDMWLPYGSRTVSKYEANYDPDFGYQLVGGLWHNLTAWIAYCIRQQNPEKVVEGMRNIYRLSETQRPKDFVNVVPGQFPERLHGETFVSRGMSLSPWMPPTYLWLGVEGLLGVKCSLERIEMNPALPSSWEWVAVENLLCRGKTITTFLYKGTIYSTAPLESSLPVKVGLRLETHSAVDHLLHIGLYIEGEIILFAASDKKVAGNVDVMCENVRISKDVSLDKGAATLFHISVQQTVNQHSTL